MFNSSVLKTKTKLNQANYLKHGYFIRVFLFCGYLCKRFYLIVKYNSEDIESAVRDTINESLSSEADTRIKPELNESRLRSIIREELTKQEVRNIVSDKLASFTKDKEFEKAVSDITVEVFDKFFQFMWSRKTTWKSGIKY